MAEKYIVTVERVESGNGGIIGVAVLGWLLIMAIYWVAVQLGFAEGPVESGKVPRTEINLATMEEGPYKNLAKTLDLKPCSQVPKFNDNEELCLKD